MRRVVCPHYGGPEVLELVESPDPRPGTGEARVRVLAAGVSYTDLLIRAGTYLGGPEPPFTVGYDLVGVVDELGPGCSTLRHGQRVAALTVWGSYAELVCLPESELVPVPDSVDPAEAVSLVLSYVTAYQLLHRTAMVRAGETLLVHGAGGGVGTGVLELARLADIRVLGTASRAKHALVERLGGIPIDYRSEDFLTRVRELTGDGVDAVFDGIGGRVSLRSLRALRRGGRLVIFGHYSTLERGHRSRRGWLEWYAATAAVGLLGLAWPGRRVLAYRIAKLRQRHPDWFRTDLGELLHLLEDGKIAPQIAARMPLAEARRAHELVADRAVAGKLVLIP